MLLDDACRWIAFDAVGTLIFADPPVAEIYHRIGQKYGSALTLPQVQQRFAGIFGKRSQMQNHPTSEPIEYEFWRDVVSEVLVDVTDKESCFIELHEWFARPTSWRCYEDVGPTIQALRVRGYQLAIASNFDHRLNSVCDGLNGLRDISTRVISSEVGWRKPHAGFYQALIDECGGKANEIVMIGDDPTNDAWGANQAGLRAVLINRRLSTDSMCTGDSIIRSLQELVMC